MKRKRKSAAARGYDPAWRALRARFLAAFPFCARCGRPAALVDHIRPITGPADPLRLAWSNLQPLCQSCHSGAKQAADNRARRRAKGPRFDKDGFPIR